MNETTPLRKKDLHVIDYILMASDSELERVSKVLQQILERQNEKT